MRVMISAGEASGDQYAADLAAELKRLDPGVELIGMGGSRLEGQGAELLFNPTAHSTIGFLESLAKLAPLRRGLKTMVESLGKRRPDVLVTIDYVGFNLPLAREANRLGIPVVYFIPPAVWAWGASRAAKVAEVATRVLSIFPFEVDIYEKAGANVQFVGHPLVDRLAAPRKGRDEVRRELGLDPNRPFVALLPGSRRQEIATLAPVMAEAAGLLRRKLPDVAFGVPVAYTVSRDHLRRALGGTPVIEVDGQALELMDAADAAAISNGTATLEAALLGLPSVSLYKLSEASYQLAKRLVKIRHVALPNIIMEREVIPELLQREASGERVSRELYSFLHDRERTENVRRDLSDLADRLGAPGAVRRAAEVVREVVSEREAA